MKKIFAFLALLLLMTCPGRGQEEVRKSDPGTDAQPKAWKSVFGVNTGISIPVNEFALHTFTYDAGFAAPGPNIEAEFLYYGKVFGLSSSFGYSNLFFNEKDYLAEYNRVLEGYGTNAVSAGNFHVMKLLVGFTLKIPEFSHTEIMLLFHLGAAVSVHPEIEVSNSRLGTINTVVKSSGRSAISNATLKVNYWMTDMYGLSMNAGLNATQPSFSDPTGPEGIFSLPIRYTNINLGFVMKIKAPRQ